MARQRKPRSTAHRTRRAATVVDVAREAGVSVASVSRVVNGHANVTPETRRRVEEVIERLRYVPHTAARSLATKRSHVIGVLLPDLHGDFFSELIRGLDAAARERRFHLLLSSARGGAEMTAAIRAMHGRVEGLVLLAPQLDATETEALNATTPAVFINSRVAEGSASPLLAINSYAGARAMVRHLIARGHTAIAHLAGPVDNFDAQERERGYRDELAASLKQVRPRIHRGDFTEQSGFVTGHAIADLAPRPTAVFAANDIMALGCLRAFAARGIAVPDDIAVVGFDDIPISSYVRPPLTTMRVEIVQIGRAAITQLVSILDGETAPPTTYFEPALVIRDSCGSQPVRDDGGPDEVVPRIRSR